MTEKTPEQIEKPKSKLKPLWLVLKILFTIVVLCAITITVLANIGGNSEALKTAIEDYFHDATGYDAQVGRLNNLSFFPNINIDFEDLELREPGNENPSVLIDKLNLKLGFFDGIYGTGKVKNIGIDNLQMKAGIISQDPLHIATMGIVDDAGNSDKAKLVIKGELGKQAIEASTSIAAYGAGADRKYDLGTEREVTLAVGDINLSWYMKNPSLSHIDLEKLKLTRAGQIWLTGDLDIKVKGNGRLVTGDVTLGKGSKIQPDVLIGEHGATGTITAPVAHVEDIAALTAIMDQVTALAPHKEKTNDKIDFQGQKTDVTFDFPKLMLNDKELGAQKISLVIKDNMLNVTAKDGTLAGGQSAITASLKPQDKAYNLSVIANLTRLPMADLIKIANGNVKINTQLDGYITMQATAQNWDDLAKNIHGRVTTTLDQGQFESALLDLWGNGLGSLILPNFSPQKETEIKCALADASIDKGLATVTHIFMDNPNVTLFGAGTYDLDKDNLNLKLTPQTKSVSIGDISAGVRVSGPLSKPRFAPDAYDVGKKVAGALLGSVNPAFLAMAGVNSALFNETKEEQVEDLCAKLATFTDGNKAKAMGEYLKTQQK